MKALIPKLIPVLVAMFTLNAVAATTRYVNLNNPSPAPPYLDWSTAATNIQHAVDAAVAGDEIVVTNGVYQTGGRAVNGGITNRVAVTARITLRSVNGSGATVIQGYQVPGVIYGSTAVRGVYLTNGAVLTGFTITGGGTVGGSAGDVYGGGIQCNDNSAVISNCVITGNAATEGGGASHGTFYQCQISNNFALGYSESGGGGVAFGVINDCVITGNAGIFGGGVIICTVNNSLITGNSASYSGGGTYGSTLNNCTLTGNSATYGGGDYISTLNNCIVHYNTAPNGSNHNSSTMNYCCTVPLPGSGMGNFTNAPFFVDSAGGNFRLQTSSTCINAGNNASAPAGPDLDGRPRIIGGTVDVGAYEFQGTGIGEFIAWLQNSGLPTDGSADYTDADGDGMDNYGEWRSDTSPTNALSVLRMVNATNSPNGKTVTWQSVSTRNYWLERATNLGLASPFQTIATNIAGVAGVKSFTDTSATNAGPYFYRVGVQ